MNVEILDWRSLKTYYETNGKTRVRYHDLGSRCFATKAAAGRYAAKMSKLRPGRARISADTPTIGRRDWDK